MGSTFTSTAHFVVEECYKCGVPFGLPRDLRQSRLNDGETFWCPNGHDQHYTTSNLQREQRKAERLAAELQRERAQSDQDRARLRDQLKDQKHRTRAQKAAKTRIKNRVAAAPA